MNEGIELIDKETMESIRKGATVNFLYGCNCSEPREAIHCDYCGLFEFWWCDDCEHTYNDGYKPIGEDICYCNRGEDEYCPECRRWLGHESQQEESVCLACGG